MLENLLNLIEKHTLECKLVILNSILQIKKIDDFDKINIIFDKIVLSKSFLDNIYLALNEDLKNIMNQRIGEQKRLVQILGDFERIDDEDTRKYLVGKIKDGFYDE